jgi:hypothetical protein
MGRDHESATSADLHSDDASVPPLDDVTGTEGKGKRFVTVPRRVELFAARDADADVMNDRVTTGGRLVARADDDLFNQEVIGGWPEVRFN